MYQNAYYEKEGGIIHCWDDKKVILQRSTETMLM